MRSTLVRGAAVVTGPVVSTALALSLTLAPAQAAIATPSGADPAPATAGASYLAAQPGANNIIKTYYVFPANTPPQSFDDYGLTIDAATALDAVGGQAAKVTAMTSALETNANTYATSAAATAKLLSFLLSQGKTTAVETNLTTSLQSHIGTTAPNVGRLEETDPANDFNTPLTQAYAANALNNAGSDLANSALSFLLQQQCTAGFFRTSLSDRAAADQTCNGTAGATGSADTTGLAVLMLHDQKSKPVVKASIEKALDWLTSQQGANGSFGGNANSTGLAGWALGVGGRTAAAAKAAGWLRGQQLANAGTCAKYAAKDNGAVTLDSLGLTNAGTGPMGQVDNSVATRATAQALPALLWAPGGAAAGDTTLTAPTGFKPAGAAQTVSLTGAPGNTVCVTGGTGAATRVVLDASGKGTATVTAPATTGKVTVTSVDAGGETDTASFTALAAADLTVKAKKTVQKGDTFKVTVKGLVAGEDVTIKVGKKSMDATANAHGKARVEATATKLGKTRIKAVGAFANRKGKATVTVVA